MNYFVVDAASGNKYGPADLNTLQQWISEGRVTPQTMLEDATNGAQMPASQVLGLSFGTPAPAGPPSQPAPSAPYASPEPSPYPRGFEQSPGQPVSNDQNSLIITSYVLSAVGLCVCPIVFSGAAIACAVTAKNRGDQRGQTAMIIGIASLVIGIIIGAVVGFSGAMQRLGR